MTCSTRRLRCGLVALALAACAPSPSPESSSPASTCSVSTEVYWTPDLEDASPPDTSCFPVDIPVSPDGSTPCTLFVATGSEACRADHGTLPLTDDERRALDQADAAPATGSICRLAQVAADAEGACSEPGFCVARGPAAATCALSFRVHPAVRPETPWHVRLWCPWPAPCP